MASSSSIDRLARSVRRADDPPWVPRAPRPTMHLGWLDAVDVGRNTVTFRSNDPSDLVLPDVRYLQAYSAIEPPQAGDVVRALHFGTAFMILGRHVVPGATITLS